MKDLDGYPARGSEGYYFCPQGAPNYCKTCLRRTRNLDDTFVSDFTLKDELERVSNFPELDQLQNFHGLGHNIIGGVDDKKDESYGDMANPVISPNDPLFYSMLTYENLYDPI